MPAPGLRRAARWLRGQVRSHDRPTRPGPSRHRLGPGRRGRGQVGGEVCRADQPRYLTPSRQEGGGSGAGEPASRRHRRLGLVQGPTLRHHRRRPRDGRRHRPLARPRRHDRPDVARGPPRHRAGQPRSLVVLLAGRHRGSVRCPAGRRSMAPLEERARGHRTPLRAPSPRHHRRPQARRSGSGKPVGRGAPPGARPPDHARANSSGSVAGPNSCVTAKGGRAGEATTARRAIRAGPRTPPAGHAAPPDRPRSRHVAEGGATRPPSREMPRMGAEAGPTHGDGRAPRVGRCPGRRGADQRIRVASRTAVERSSPLVSHGPPVSHETPGAGRQDTSPGERGEAEAHPAPLAETTLVRLGPSPGETDCRSPGSPGRSPGGQNLGAQAARPRNRSHWSV
jgi:hypothetical protein